MSLKPYTVYAVEGRSHGAWRRVALWTTVTMVVLLLVGAGASYLWFRSQVGRAQERLDPEVVEILPSSPASTLATTVVVEPASPDAMNVLVLGSDKRQEAGEEYGRSDTVMLVHVDPDRDYLALMSLPRDLRVQIPGHGRDKLNAAFAFGGPALTIRTVEDLTGIDVNHYLEVDFQAFRDITDALGGVYVDVDRRYYNDNPERELIKLAPGYQLLRGEDALDYVRFRHDLNADFGRMERQQRFLSATREQAMSWDLPFKLPGLIGALFSNVNTSLGTNDILRIAYWGIRLDGSRISQISLSGDTQYIGGISYVIASDRALEEAVVAFLSPPGTGSSPETTDPGSPPAGATTSTTEAPPEAPQLDGIEVDVLNGSGRAGQAAAAAEWLGSLGADVVDVGNAEEGGRERTVVRYPANALETAEIVAAAVAAESVEASLFVERITVVLGLDFEIPSDFEPRPNPETIPDSSEWKALASMISFPLQAPAYLPEGYAYFDRMPPTGATFDIEVGRGTRPALKMIYRLRERGARTDQYMGITATTWVDAPAASKGQEVVRGDVVYTIVGSSQKVERVWWKADGVLYWVSNTISYRLDRDEILKVAQSMIPIPRP